MAAPNIVNVTTITGKTTVQAATTVWTSYISNSAASGQLYKVNFISFANNTSGSVNGSVDVYRSSTSYPIAANITVPANSTMVMSGKDTAIYLEEGDTIRLYSSANSSIYVSSSYEIIS
jgi:hypothetical protein